MFSLCQLHWRLCLCKTLHDRYCLPMRCFSLPSKIFTFHTFTICVCSHLPSVFVTAIYHLFLQIFTICFFTDIYHLFLQPFTICVCTHLPSVFHSYLPSVFTSIYHLFLHLFTICFYSYLPSVLQLFTTCFYSYSPSVIFYSYLPSVFFKLSVFTAILHLSCNYTLSFVMLIICVTW